MENIYYIVGFAFFWFIVLALAGMALMLLRMIVIESKYWPWFKGWFLFHVWRLRIPSEWLRENYSEFHYLKNYRKSFLEYRLRNIKDVRRKKSKSN